MLLFFNSDIVEIVLIMLISISKSIVLEFFKIVNFKIFDKKNSCNFINLIVKL
jgi:hypothetical protein